MTSFASLGITEPILTALTDYGYAEPTVIQEKAIPAGIAGRDVLGSAQTGTGKTCAFGVPILQRLAQGGRGRTIRALILTPPGSWPFRLTRTSTPTARTCPSPRR